MIVLTSEVSLCKTYLSSSLQFNLPKLATRKIIQWGEENISDKDIYNNPNLPQYGREYESHVTILNGIKDENPKRLKRILQKQKPFHIEFGKVSVFDCPNFDVVKIEVESVELRRLNKLLQEHLGLFSDNRFHPHVTIAFLKKNNNFFSKTNDFVGNKILADRLTFSSVSGVQTTIELKGHLDN